MGMHKPRPQNILVPSTENPHEPTDFALSYLFIEKKNPDSYGTLLSLLHSTNWNTVFDCKDTNSAWGNFKIIFTQIYMDKIAQETIKEIRFKQRTQPWMNSRILDLIHVRDHNILLFRKTGDVSYYDAFCTSRNLVQCKIKLAKSNYVKGKDKVQKHI